MEIGKCYKASLPSSFPGLATACFPYNIVRLKWETGCGNPLQITKPYIMERVFIININRCGSMTCPHIRVLFSITCPPFLTGGLLYFLFLAIFQGRRQRWLKAMALPILFKGRYFAKEIVLRVGRKMGISKRLQGEIQNKRFPMVWEGERSVDFTGSWSGPGLGA